MIAALSLLLASPTALAGDSGVTSLDGRCAYPDRVARFRQQTILVTCDSLAIDRRDDAATFDFGQRDWGSTLRVTGTMSGQRLAITTVRPRSGGAVAATGSCEIFYSDGKISVVSCLVRAGSKTYAANFVASRL